MFCAGSDYEKKYLFHLKSQRRERGKCTVLPPSGESQVWGSKSRKGTRCNTIQLFSRYNKFQPSRLRAVFCSSPSLFHLFSGLFLQPTCLSPLSFFMLYWHRLACLLHFLLPLSSIWPCQSSPNACDTPSHSRPLALLPSHFLPSPTVSSVSILPNLAGLIPTPPPLPSLFLSSIPVDHFFIVSCSLITSLLFLLSHQSLHCPISPSVPLPNSLQCLSLQHSTIPFYCFMCCFPVPLSHSHMVP